MDTRPDTIDPAVPMVRLFGAVQAVADYEAITAPKQRKVLALLALNAGRWVGFRKLADELWEDPPRTWITTLQMYVSNIRNKLPEGIIVTRSSGYVLDVMPDDVDALRFLHCVKEADKQRTEGRFEEALRLLDEALSLFGSDLLEGVEHGVELAPLSVRLHEERRSALRSRFEILLKCGRHAKVLDELLVVWRADPANEDLAGLLMLALYRSQQAIKVYEIHQLLKRKLRQKYDSDVSPVITTLYRLIIARDPELLKPEWTLDDLMK